LNWRKQRKNQQKLNLSLMKKAELYSKLLQQLKDNNKSPDIIAAIEEALARELKNNKQD
jgi:hypothetical protein